MGLRPTCLQSEALSPKRKGRKEGQRRKEGREEWRENLDLIITACKCFLLLEIATSKMLVLQVTELYLRHPSALNELHCAGFNFEICLKEAASRLYIFSCDQEKGKILAKGIGNTMLLNQAALEEEVVLW